MSDGRHAAAIALLGNYIAGSFVAMADGHGGNAGHGSANRAAAVVDPPAASVTPIGAALGRAQQTAAVKTAS
jgi:hypothetical protein